MASEQFGLMNRKKSSRAGLTLPEVLVVLVIVGFFGLLLLSRMPRGREEARSATCLANLGQIGQAVNYYAQATGQYPQNQRWDRGSIAKPGSSVLWALRAQFQLADFAEVEAQVKAKKEGQPKAKTELSEVPLGLRCPSDRARKFAAAVNYRANAGSEPEGRTGPFAIGEKVTPAQVEAADGLSFTAAMAERLIGNGENGMGPNNYQMVPNCRAAFDVVLAPLIPGKVIEWEGNAGHDWTRGDWVNSLYHHGMRPQTPISAVASSGDCGQMGASSAHADHVNVLLLDGSAKPWRVTVDPLVWSRLGNYRDEKTGEIAK